MDDFLLLDVCLTTQTDMLSVLEVLITYFTSTKGYFFLKKVWLLWYEFVKRVYYFFLVMVLLNSYVLHTTKKSIYLYSPKNGGELSYYVEFFATVVHNTSFSLLYFIYSGGKLRKSFLFLIRALIINFLGLNVLVIYVFLNFFKLKQSGSFNVFFIEYFVNTSDNRKLIFVDGSWVANPMFSVKKGFTFLEHFESICKKRNVFVDTINNPTIKDSLFELQGYFYEIKKKSMFSFRALKKDELSISEHRVFPDITNSDSEGGMVTDARKAIKNDFYGKEYVISKSEAGVSFSKPSSILAVDKATLDPVPGSEKKENALAVLGSFDIKNVNDHKINPEFFDDKLLYDDAIIRFKCALLNSSGVDQKKIELIIKDLTELTDDTYLTQFNPEFQDN